MITLFMFHLENKILLTEGFHLLIMILQKYKIMYIDSPNFPRHKVLLGQSPNPEYRKNNKEASYFGRNGFGSQRIKLAQFVQSQLNEKHKNDAEVLQRFRREAQQYKKSLRKNVSYKSQTVLTPSVFQNPIEVKHIQTEKSEQEQEVRRPQKIVLRQIGIQTDVNQRKLLKQLNKKEKQLKKRERVIKKNQQKIKELNHKLRKIEHENIKKDLEESRKFENESIIKIKQLVSSLSDRLQDNNELLEDRKSKIRVRKSQKIKPPIIQREQSPNNQLKNSNMSLKHDWEDRPIVNYTVKVDAEVKKEKSSIGSYLKNLQYNRSRLEQLNQQD